METLINKIVRITSDNENYIPYLDKDLIVTACYYEEGKDEEPIYDLDIINSLIEFPFSLYKWEFEII